MPSCGPFLQPAYSLLHFPSVSSSQNTGERILFGAAILLTPFKPSPASHGDHSWHTQNQSHGFARDNTEDLLLSFATLPLISSEISSF